MFKKKKCAFSPLFKILQIYDIVLLKTNSGQQNQTLIFSWFTRPHVWKQANSDFFELTVTAEMHILLVEADGVKNHFLLFAALAEGHDFLLGFELLAARPAAKHSDTTLWRHTAIRVG